MKKITISILSVLIFSATFLISQEEESIKEKVNVVNIEIPVRVYYKNEPVNNLTKDDFKIYEGKKLQTINGFFVKRKIIAHKISEQEETSTGYFFVLIFQITDFNDEFKKGLDYLFNNMINENDQILLVVNKKSFSFNNLSDKKSVQESMENIIKTDSEKERLAMFQYINQIEQELNLSKFETEVRRSSSSSGLGDTPHYAVKDFLSKYLMIWNDYKSRYLVPDIEEYYKFSQYLKNIKKEKWVINFYQLELFPRIILDNNTKRFIRNQIAEWEISANQEIVTFARIIDKLLIDIDRSLKISNDFPSDEVTKIFYKVNAIYHSIFIRTNLPTLIQDNDYIKIAGDIESNLREICQNTGGLLINSKDLETALESISKKEDIYYLLTYAPKNPEQVGKIKIKVNKKRCKVIYDDAIRGEFINEFLEQKEIKGPPVKINSVSFKNKQLKIELSNFYIMKTKQGSGGKLKIRIRINNIQEITIYDETKEMSANQDKVKISLDFSSITRGKYEIIVDVTDMYTEKTATELIQAEIK